jgi:hypothetical protein
VRIGLPASLIALVVSAAASASATAHVRLVSAAPIVIRGSGFQSHERVAVTVRSGATRLLLRVSSTSNGAFTARFVRRLRVAPCEGIAVSAVGALGDKAAWKSPPPACGTELAP